MNNKTRGAIIALIVLLCLIVVALTGLMVFLLTGNTVGFNRVSFLSYSHVYHDETYDAQGIDDIEIISNAGDINVVSSTDGQIRVVADGNNEELFSVEQIDSRLVITSKSKESKNKALKNLKGNFGGADIDVYLPQTIGTLTIESNFGDVEIENSFEGRVKAEIDFGDFDAQSLLGSFDVHCDLGDIKIGRADITEASAVTTEMGDVEIESTNDVNIDARTSLGECSVKNNNPNSAITLKAESNLGDVEVN